MRLFLGIRAKLKCYEEIKKDFHHIFEGKWVEEKNLHTTLYFFGDVKNADLIKQKLQTITFPKEKIILKGIGTFGYPPKILFVNPKNNIYQKSRLHLEELFGKTDKKFYPHITILRIKKILDSNFKERIKKYKNRELGHLEKEAILFKSKLTKEGAIYKELEVFL